MSEQKEKPAPEKKKPKISATKAEQIFVKELYERNFFACLFSGLQKRANYNIPTLQVVLDPRTMRHIALEYNPDFLAEDYDRSPALFRFNLAHEGAHIVLRHIPRWFLHIKKKALTPFERQRANIAADLAANSLCLSCVAPSSNFSSKAERAKYIEDFRSRHMANDCWPDKFGFEWGLTFEQYYDLLKDKFPTPDKMKIAVIDPNGDGDLEIPDDVDMILIKSSGGQGDKEKDKEADMQGQDQGEATSESKSQGGGKGTSKGKSKQLNLPKNIPIVHEHQWMDEDQLNQALEDAANSLADKAQEDSREGAPTCHFGDQGFAAPDFDASAMEAMMGDFVHGVIKDYERRNGRGTLPGNLSEVIPQLFTVAPAKIPWELIVKRIISKAVPQEDDEIFSLPNRRLYHLRASGVFPFPSYIQISGMKIAIIRDTSGSMGGPEIEEVVSIVFSFLKAYPASEVYLVDADTKVHSVTKISEKADLPSEVKGRGGTDFIQPIAYVEEHLKPDFIFYGTDGYGSAPAKAPKTPIAWFMTYHSHVPANYGLAIQIDTGEILQK